MNCAVNPILAEVYRGQMVESFHRGAAAVCDAAGNLLERTGDVERLIYPRSAIKPLQAMALAESGAIERFGLTHCEIALACASHSGQPLHVDRIRQWLAKIEVHESSFECGSQPSTHRSTRLEMIRSSQAPTAIYNNCSGKHAGFMTIAKYQGAPIAGYTDYAHPVQQQVLAVVEELTSEPVTNREGGLDGCGIPVIPISLTAIARAFARLAGGAFESAKRKRAAESICLAMQRYPELVGGEQRFCTAVPKFTHGQVLIKVGAEGVYAGLATAPRPLGFALKIDDGARRAAEVAMGALILRHCRLTGEAKDGLAPWLAPQVHTVAGKPAGSMTAASA